MNRRDEGLTIDLHGNDINYGQVDTSAYALAAVFGPVAFPVGMPDYLKAAIMDRAEQNRDAAGDLLIDNRMDPDDPRHRQTKADAADDDNLSQFAQLVRQEHEEREREEWAHTAHELAGRKLSGAQWVEIGDELKPGGRGRTWLLDDLMRQGKTSAEAEETADDLQLAATGTSKREADRSAAEAGAITKINADPALAATLDRYVDARASGFKVAGPTALKLISSDRSTSVNARADALDDGIVGAPDLSEHHRAALAATAPLDAPAVAPTSTPTMQRRSPP